MRQARLNAVTGPALALFAALAAVAVLVVGSERLSAGEGGPGEVFAFLLYAALLTRPVGGLANMYGAYQIASGTLGRLETVMAMPQEAGYDMPRTVERAEGSDPVRRSGFRLSRTPTGVPQLRSGDRGGGDGRADRG